MGSLISPDTPLLAVFAIYIIWNIAVFLLYGIDKFKSKIDSYRISEKTLIKCAVIFGGIGALFGMLVFRHKTKHTKFIIIVPVCAALNLVLFFGYLYERIMSLI